MQKTNITLLRFNWTFSEKAPIAFKKVMVESNYDDKKRDLLLTIVCLMAISRNFKLRESEEKVFDYSLKNLPFVAWNCRIYAVDFLHAREALYYFPTIN